MFESLPIRPGIEERDVTSYRYEPIPGTLNVLTVLQALDSYEYQACEDDAWRTSQARRFCLALQRACVRSLPGIDQEPWFFEDRSYFLTHTER